MAARRDPEGAKIPPVERMVEQGRRSLVHRGMKAKRFESGMRRVGMAGVWEERERAREWPDRLRNKEGGA